MVGNRFHKVQHGIDSPVGSGNDEAWQNEAACRGIKNPDIFFDEKAFGIDEQRQQKTIAAAAKEICRRCGVQVTCLNYAITTGQVGVWGGMTTAERRHLVRSNAQTQ